MTGFIVDDSEVLKGLCGGIGTDPEPIGYGYSIRKDMRLSSGGFDTLCTEFRKGILDIVDNISSGRFSPSPKPDSANKYACRYCPYSAVCGLVVRSEN